jgi:hypothetical protein
VLPVAPVSSTGCSASLVAPEESLRIAMALCTTALRRHEPGARLYAADMWRYASGKSKGPGRFGS